MSEESDLDEPYRPDLIYYADGDVLEFTTEDCAVVYRLVAPGVQLVLRMGSDEVVGFTIDAALVRARLG